MNDTKMPQQPQCPKCGHHPEVELRIGKQSLPVAEYVRRTSGQISLLTLYGFPVALTAGFFSFSFSKLPTAGPLAGFIDSIHWPALTLFVLISALLMGLLFAVTRWIQHRSRLSGCEISQLRDAGTKEGGGCRPE